MKLFRNYTFTWWQVTLFKFYLAIAGVIAGVYFYDFFSTVMPYLVIAFLVLMAYFIYAMLKHQI